MSKKIIMALCIIIMGLLAPSVFSSSQNNTPGDVTYTLAWNQGEAEATEDGWLIVNDLGYEIEITQGYIVSNSVQLIECEHSHGFFDSIFGWLGWMMPSTVYAGHGSEIPDPSRLEAPRVESLMTLEPVEMGTATLNEPSYCQAHYLIGYANHKTVNMPNSKDMTGISLYIEGKYRLEGGEWIPFVIESGLANGKLDDLIQHNKSVHIETSETTHITFYRQLDTIFDGIDFATMNADAQGKAAVWSLIGDTQAIVTQGKVH